MSLYRKYRPKSLPDVIGQDHVTTTLENAVAQDKLANAYLFAGPRGTGKTSVARILAKAILSHGMEDDTLKRKVLESVDDGSLVDLVEIDAASNRGIDDIRSLVEKIQFTPVVAKAKVYIIDEVHMLTREAFNALLKTLEEPPAYAFFILATTELQKIPATIQSRCQRFQFRQIKEEDIIQSLQKIADAEHIQIDRPALRAVAHHAQGGMRDAISLLDQLRSLPKVSLTDVQEKIGESGQEFVEAVYTAIDAGDRSAVIDVVARVEQAGVPLDVFTRQLLAEARERLHGAVDRNESTDRWSDVLTRLLSAIRDIRISPVPALPLEAALLSLASPAQGATAEASGGLFRRKTKPEPVEEPKAEKPDAPKPIEAPKQIEKHDELPAPAALVEAPEVSAESIKEHWHTLLAAVSPAWVRMSLKNGFVRSVRGSTVILSFPSAFHRDKVASLEGAHQVEEILQKIFHRPLKIDCVLDEQRGAAPVKQEMVNLAEAASEVF